jgi:hypothetical protein
MSAKISAPSLALTFSNNSNIQVGDEVVVYSRHAADKNSVVSVAYEHRSFAYHLLTNLSPGMFRYVVT